MGGKKEYAAKRTIMPDSQIKARPARKWRIIIPATLILGLIAAAFIVPWNNRRLYTKRSTEIRAALEAVRNAVDNQWKSSGSISGITMEQAIQEAGLGKRILDNWQFYASWKLTDIYTAEMVEKLKDVITNQTTYVAPYRMIMAVATAGNPVGEGTKIWLYGDTNTYHGFGVDERVEPDWSVIFPNP